MSQSNQKQFFELYQEARFEDQLEYYKSTQKVFDRAKTEAINGSITLIFLAGLAGIAASLINIHGYKLLFLMLAAILPIFSTALAAYNTLYSFEQQAKLYQDTINNLQHARALAPIPENNLSDAEFTHLLNDYVQEVEKIFQQEQGQWGQLAEKMKPSDT